MLLSCCWPGSTSPAALHQHFFKRRGLDKSRRGIPRGGRRDVRLAICNLGSLLPPEVRCEEAAFGFHNEIEALTDFAAAIGRRVAHFENATAYALVNQANGDGPTLTNGPAAVFGTAAAAPIRPQRAVRWTSTTSLPVALPSCGKGRWMVCRFPSAMP
ncbi:MAG: hypothetical protein ACR2IG_10550 [Roseomonas sp.]